METALLTGLGLAAPAGLNAYLPLLVLALAARLNAGVTLSPPFDALSSTPGILVLIALLTIEIVVDKVPGIDHVNDLIQTVVRPLAGAVLMLAATGSVQLATAVAVPLGLVAAGTVHAAKAASRPAVTVGSAGLFNPLVSFAEDLAAAVASLVAIFAPALVLLVLLLFALFVVAAFHRVRRLRSHLSSAVTSSSLRR